MTWELDTTPPVTHAAVNAAHGTTSHGRLYTNAATVTLSLGCGGERLPQACSYCVWQDSSALLCGTNASVTVPYTHDGEVTMFAQATDDVGNVDTSTVNVTWVWDTVPPVVVGDVSLSGQCHTVSAVPTATRSAAVAARGSDGVNATAVNGVAVCVVLSTLATQLESDQAVNFTVAVEGSGSMSVTSADGEPVAVVVQPLTSFTAQAVTALATDAAGNTAQIPWSVVVLPVPTLPVAAVTDVVPAVTNATNVTFAVTARFAGAPPGVTAAWRLLRGFDVHWSFTLLSASESPAVPPPPSAFVPVSDSDEGIVVSAQGLTSGWYNATVFAVDVLGGVDVAGARVSVVVDTQPPSCVCGVQLPAAVNTSDLVVAAVASDSQSATTWYSAIDDESWVAPSPSSTVVVFVAVPDGPHRVSCRAVDAAGNEQAPPLGEWVVTVDTHPPVVAVELQSAQLRAGVYTANATMEVCVTVSDELQWRATVVVNGGASAALSSSSCVAFVADVDGETWDRAGCPPRGFCSVPRSP